MITTLQKPAAWAALSAAAVALFAVFAFAHAQVVSGSLSGQIGLGSSGTDVTKLQTLLASNRDIYPEALVTGYYGSLTAKAVARFQLDYGLSPVGRVGPLTLAKVNGILTMPAPVLDIYGPTLSGVTVAPNGTSATITWTTDEAARGKVYFSTTPFGVITEASGPMQEPVLSGSMQVENTFGASHSVTLNNLAPSTTYYYAVVSADAAGNASMTWPQTFVTTQ